MEKILVPIDFSDFSQKALDYAALIAQKAHSEITICHATVPHIPPGANAHLYQQDVKEQLRASKQKLAEITTKYTNQYNYDKDGQSLVIDFEIIEDLPADAIANWVTELDPYLIVMGTQGATGLQRVMLGSVTTAVMERVHCPVMAIPEKAEVKSLDKIVYASNFDRRDSEVIDLLMNLASYFTADIECLHINTDLEKLQEAENRMAVLEEKYWFTSLNQLRFRIEKGEGGFEKGLDDYLSSHETDLLVMLTHERSFLEGLFHRSQTKNMAFHTTVPLLVFKSPKK